MENFNVDIDKIIELYGFSGTFNGVEIIRNGHINSTFVLGFSHEDGSCSKYLVQRINTFVFKQPEKLMQNIVGVTEFLRKKISKNGGDPDRETLTVLPTKDGERCFFDNQGDCWRCYIYIDDSYTCNVIDNAEVFYNAGKAFGKFQNMLSDYPIDTLNETIPNFHNTYSRFLDLLTAVKEDKADRVRYVRDEIEFAITREEDTKVLVSLIESGELPIRVTHNDTKLNNILFDSDTNEGLCIIDLDTVMPGLSLYDFGDSIRFGASTAAEDEKSLSKVSMSLELFKAYADGYLSTAKGSLVKAEIENLAFASKVMTFECGMRFLTDYLNGDTYFKTDYPEHNLVRCRTQFKLVVDMEEKMEKMNGIIRNSFEEDVS